MARPESHHVHAAHRIREQGLVVGPHVERQRPRVRQYVNVNRDTTLDEEHKRAPEIGARGAVFRRSEDGAEARRGRVPVLLHVLRAPRRPVVFQRIIGVRRAPAVDVGRHARRERIYVRRLEREEERPRDRLGRRRGEQRDEPRPRHEQSRRSRPRHGSDVDLDVGRRRAGSGKQPRSLTARPRRCAHGSLLSKCLLRST
mmetsp:Transcript_28001/g.86616  ORF Transcript_28001/g.86616 Transcript_28001/m.86616 type:complete len:200 (-) Transcript_28001:566-1165(-)